VLWSPRRIPIEAANIRNANSHVHEARILELENTPEKVSIAGVENPFRRRPKYTGLKHERSGGVAE